jgi:cell division septation protein DedD
MARDWRGAVLAAIAAAMLGCACALGAFAQQGEEEHEDEAKAAPEKVEKAKKKQDPAEAQRAIEAALKQLQAGKAEQAVQALTATLAGGNLPPAILAKALYVRGMAHRRQGRPAQAISDLAGALWLKGGLGGDERQEAMKEKSAAYADAGLADPGESQGSSKTSSAGGPGSWLSGIFGGGSQEPAPHPKPKVSALPPAPKISPPPVEEAEPPPSSAPKVAVDTPWTSDIEEVEETPETPKAGPSKTAKAGPPPSAKRVEGHYLVQLAAMRTEAEALALAARAKREHASLLGSRSQSVDRAVFGNMGAFYRVRFGPFASAQETQSVCAKLQNSGIDCLPVSQ